MCTGGQPGNSGNTAAMDIRALKQALRAEVTQKLKQMLLTEVDRQSAAIQRNVLATDSYKKATRVGIYLAMQHVAEVRTSLLVEDALKQGKKVFIPRVLDKDTMGLYRALSVEDVAAFEVSKWNIPEPPTDREEAMTEGLDLLIVPGVAFDTQGRRMGHGRGYYDRYISRLKCPAYIALALHEQMVPQVPVGEFDLKMDVVITPDGMAYP